MPDRAPGPISDAIACEVCQEALPAHAAFVRKEGAPVLCDEPECRVAYEFVNRQGPGARQMLLESRRREIKAQRDIRRRPRRYAEWVQGVWSRQREAAYSMREAIRPGWAERDVLVIDLPQMNSDLRPLSESRKAAFEEHARQVVARAIEQAPRSEDELREDMKNAHRVARNQQQFAQMPDLRKASDGLCAACRGGCCAKGGDKAYVSEATVARVLADHPDWGVDDLVQAWTDYLPEQSVSSSCIFQASDGCRLPRDLRSDVCNGYYCAGLVALQKRAMKEGAIPPSIAVQRRGDVWSWGREGRDHTVMGLLVVDGENVVPSGLNPSVLPTPGDPPEMGDVFCSTIS